MLILANIAASFLIWAGYLLLTECTLWLLQILPNVSADALETDLVARIIETVLQIVTIVVIIILLGRSIVSGFKFLMQEIKTSREGDEIDANKDQPEADGEN